MLGEVQLIHGIGVRIAHNTLRPSTKEPLADLVLTSVINANRRNKTGNAQHSLRSAENL